LIYHVARRAGLSEADADDCVQETVVEIVNGLPRFKRERPGSFRSWLCTVTRTQIKRFYRKKYQHERRREAFSEELLVQEQGGKGTDLDVVWDEEWQRNLLRAALARVKRLVSPGQYQIFHCTMLQEWTVPEVCAKLGVSRGSVYVAKHRVNALMRRELQDLMEAK
jgi:RNA polymerase sigma factor (sigma-70 family)